jgi:outer membrane protein OmpA-like peptidoglycan-associated protein
MRFSRTCAVLQAVLFVALQVSAQAPDRLKQAHEIGRRAAKAAEAGNLHFVHAETLFEEALSLAPDDPKLNASMGLCQLNGPFRHKALPYLVKAYELAPNTPHLAFLTAYAYQLDGQWEKAIALFEAHKAAFPYSDPDPMYNTADRHIRECRNGIAAMASPVRAEVINLGDAVNSPYPDYGPLITADGSTLLFTSRRPGGMNEKPNKATREYFEDIYTVSKQGDGWSKAALLGPPVNTPGNDACVGLFNDGSSLVVYRDMDGSGDLFESRRKNGTWTVPEAFGPNVNTPGHESSAWYSFDRQWLYFVSDRIDDNLGGQDIYRSRWDAQARTWGPPENLGPNVNTPYDEDGVFVHPDGRTIYFSSKGHNSIGGYDVFRSRYENGAWTKAESLGWPINSPDDDLFFVLTADGSTGYFSSFRKEGLGEDDIYMVRFLPDEEAIDDRMVSAAGAAPVKAPSPTAVMLKGKIRSLKTLDPLDAEVQLMDLDDGSLVASFRTDATTGEYLVAVPGGRAYAMYVKANGHLVHSEHIAVPEGGAHVSSTIDISLPDLSTGGQVILRNLFFGSGSAVVDQASLSELNQLEELLVNNPGLRLEIAGHTDNTGSANLNRSLSEARAAAVRDHLVKRGIDPARLEAKGYGDTRPVAPNDTPENKALNRRTEITVL